MLVLFWVLLVSWCAFNSSEKRNCSWLLRGEILWDLGDIEILWNKIIAASKSLPHAGLLMLVVARTIINTRASEEADRGRPTPRL